MKHTLINATPDPLVMNRRTTLRWMAAALAAGPLAACGESKSGLTWPELEKIKADGYGRDPNMLEPSYPWPLTLTQNELLAATALVDLILPADGDQSSASAVGVPAFLNEWVSAPYPDQQEDRALIVPGLAWLDQEAQTRGGRRFAHLDAAGQKAIADDIAYRDRIKPGLEKPAQFFARARSLTMGAYFTSEEGWKYLGYLGNTPATGDYAGPTPDALAHVQKLVESMGLTFNPNFDPV
jgi:hypothetical protein